jgi:hypothetical protein
MASSQAYIYVFPGYCLGALQAVLVVTVAKSTVAALVALQDLHCTGSEMISLSTRRL